MSERRRLAAIPADAYPGAPREVLKRKRVATRAKDKARIAKLEKAITQATNALKRVIKSGPFDLWERAPAIEAKLRKAL